MKSKGSKKRMRWKYAANTTNAGQEFLWREDKEGAPRMILCQEPVRSRSNAERTFPARSSDNRDALDFKHVEEIPSIVEPRCIENSERGNVPTGVTVSRADEIIGPWWD